MPADPAAAPLLPCPFCGSRDVGLPANPECAVVYCRDCGATAPVCHGPDAAGLWNRRAIPEVRDG